MSLSKGALGPEAAAGAASALESAIEDLREKYAKKEIEERKAATASAAAAEPAPAAEGEGSDDEWLDDPELEAIRTARLKELQEKSQKSRDALPPGHGEYNEIVEEEFLKEVTGMELVVCHFFHNDFERCKIMDMHLRKVAFKFPKTKFIRLNAEKAPFFVGKLAIRVLPTVVMFKSGVAKDRLLGFDRLGGDEFRTKSLERVLRAAGVVDDGKAESSSDEDEGDEPREGATYAEAVDSRRARIKASAFHDGDD